MMAVAKEFNFSVAVASAEGPRVIVSAPSVQALGIATPPEFGSGITGVWSPEDLLVAAVAACFELTFKAIVKRRELSVDAIDVHANGRVGHVPQQGLGFLAVELHVQIETSAEDGAAVEAAAYRAHEHCIVGRALAVPVALSLDVRTRNLVPA
jgi:organic hydroperoxide reductase OsmC/OhrA